MNERINPFQTVFYFPIPSTLPFAFLPPTPTMVHRLLLCLVACSLSLPGARASPPPSPAFMRGPAPLNAPLLLHRERTQSKVKRFLASAAASNTFANTSTHCMSSSMGVCVAARLAKVVSTVDQCDELAYIYKAVADCVRSGTHPPPPETNWCAQVFRQMCSIDQGMSIYRGQDCGDLGCSGCVGLNHPGGLRKQTVVCVCVV